MAEQLRVGDGMAADVECDHCGDGKTPAVRTCLRCGISFCATHLRPHVENPRLRDHVLVAPIANLAGRQCRQHQQELILYCEQDESPVCTLCTVAQEHRGHEFVPVQNAQQTKQEVLRREMTGREEKQTTAESRIEQLRGDYNRVQESLSGTRARISRKFERRREQLRQEEREALERVDEEGRSALSRIQADIDHFDFRARGLEREINQLLAALAVQDPLTFLQDPLHESLRRSSISQETQDDPATVSHGLNLAKVISVGGVQTKLLPFLDGCSPTLDTNSAHDGLQISSDLRTVTRNVSQGRPHHPHRFDGWPQALCSESFSSGQHYWEVDVGSAGLCWVGVAYGTIPRRGRGDECRMGGSDVSWCLRKYGDSFSVWHGGVRSLLSVPESPRRVGVHLDWDAGLLSFYNADSMALLHTFHQTFAQPLHPGLGLNGFLLHHHHHDGHRFRHSGSQPLGAKPHRKLKALEFKATAWKGASPVSHGGAPLQAQRLR
ncbi:tripartite motif-containing protein 16-like [Lampetra fluviatilis]